MNPTRQVNVRAAAPPRSVRQLKVGAASAPRSVRQQRGSVLVFVLWLTIGLAAAALLYGQSAMLHYRRTANQAVQSQADEATLGMLRYVTTVLGSATAGSLPDTSTYTAEDLTLGACRVWLLGQLEDSGTSSLSSSSTRETDTPTFGLTDEAGKLNLNTATLEMLEALPDMTPELAAAIIDWRDADSDVTANGAESETYLALDPAYTCKDAPFESIDELRLLHGAEATLLAGRDRNRNGLVETWERTLADNNKELAAVPDFGVLSYVTVYSREPNTDAQGQPLMNLNGPVNTVRDALIALLGTERAAAVANSAGLGRTRFASVLQFAILGKLTASEAKAVLDGFTVAAGSFVPGRVNVNTASAAVLACLPGVGESNAAKLVAYRQENSGQLDSVWWVVEAIGEDAATSAGPYITVRGYQVSADIVAVGDQGRAFRRTRFVIDTSSGTPVVIARLDLTPLGWPLGENLHQELMMPQQEARR